jgi:hypothetical protein
MGLRVGLTPAGAGNKREERRGIAAGAPSDGVRLSTLSL